MQISPRNHPPHAEQSDAGVGAGTLESTNHPGTEAVGLRERKKRATARALHETAVDLVGAHGLDDVTIEAICERAGVSTRTFFNYYPTKEDALTASMPVPPTDDDLATFEAGGPTGNLVIDLGEMVAGHMASHATTVENLAAHHRMLHREPQLVIRWRGALHAIEQRFVDAIATRAQRDPADTGVIMLGAMTATGIRTAMHRWVEDGGDPGIDVHLRRVFALLDASLDTDALLQTDAPPPTT
ncbi:MAG TPA: TetR/AcrR family transcriptional regulator [Nitriliruptoraceae bacterium]|nr:TetR/AcrR family transcriptional regulator [Nitriliruptoraceae bacterium]